MLDCQYFHVVFTVPKEIAAIAFQNPDKPYNILFHAAAETLQTIAADPKHLGAEIGFFAVLHTWGQNLAFHPHLHCVVPGGGLTQSGTQWISCRPGFFLPVAVLSMLFRRLFLEALEKAFKAGELQFFSALQSLSDLAAFRRYLDLVRRTNWVVFAKPPFAGPEQVLDYVGRYTHRVAISNHRLLGIDDGKVSFRWKDYRHGAQQKTMTLSADEFIRRFLFHVPPDGFQRIRYYGFLGNRYRKEKLARCRDSACLIPRNPRSPWRPNPSATIVIGLNSSAAFRFGSARLVGSTGWFASRFLSPSSHASRSSTRHDQRQALPAMRWPTLLGATKPRRADHHIALETRSGSGFPTIRPFERPTSRPLWSLLPIALIDDHAKFLLSCPVRGHSIPIAPNIELAASSNPFLAHRRGLQLSPSLVMNP